MFYKQSEMSEILDVDIWTVKNYFKDLKKLGIIEIKKQGLGQSSKIYFNKLEQIKK